MDLAQTGGQRDVVPRLEHQSDAAMVEDLRNGTGLGGDDGPAGEHGLDQRTPERLRLDRRVNHGIDGAHQYRNVLSMTQEAHAIGHTQFGGKVDQGARILVLAEQGAARDDASGIRHRLQRTQGDGLAFPGRQTAEYPKDHLRVRCQPECLGTDGTDVAVEVVQPVRHDPQ